MHMQLKNFALGKSGTTQTARKERSELVRLASEPEGLPNNSTEPTNLPKQRCRALPPKTPPLQHKAKQQHAEQ
jgi:hypothetical protein